jgi:hypothetical protein
MPTGNLIVAVCDVMADAVAAVALLERHGIERSSVSVVVLDERTGLAPVAYYLCDGQIRRTAAEEKPPHMWQSFTPCAVILTPGTAALVVSGPFAIPAARALEHESLFGDLGAIAGGLYSLGVSREEARKYELTAYSGRSLVIVQGHTRDVARARELLAAMK